MNRFLYLLLSATLFLTNCQKPMKKAEDFCPTVETVSAVLQTDGSVIVTGKVISTGHSAIKYCGFCMDASGPPQMLSNQVEATNLDNGTFSYTFAPTVFAPGHPYYFRAWAANTTGYNIGGTDSLNNITFDASVIPCKLVLDHMKLSRPPKNYDEKFSDAYVTDNRISAYTSDHNLSFQFRDRPVAGIYSIGWPDAHSVSIVMNGEPVVSSSKVYITQPDNFHYDVTVCSGTVIATVLGLVDTFAVSMRFRCFL